MDEVGGSDLLLRRMGFALWCFKAVLVYYVIYFLGAFQSFFFY